MLKIVSPLFHLHEISVIHLWQIINSLVIQSKIFYDPGAKSTHSIFKKIKHSPFMNVRVEMNLIIYYLFKESANQINNIIGCLKVVYNHSICSFKDDGSFPRFVNKFLIGLCRKVTEHKLQRSSFA